MELLSNLEEKEMIEWPVRDILYMKLYIKNKGNLKNLSFPLKFYTIFWARIVFSCHFTLLTRKNVQNQRICALIIKIHLCPNNKNTLNTLLALVSDIVYNGQMGFISLYETLFRDVHERFAQHFNFFLFRCFSLFFLHDQFTFVRR